jgi:hypothetical protein
VRVVTFRWAVLAAVLFASLVVTAAAASPPRYVQHEVVFVTMNGHGTVSTVPRGVTCPKVCRAAFVSGTHVQVVARPAAGWKLEYLTSNWCKASAGVCQFDLVSPHDCDSGACPLGTFGLQVSFVRD